MSRQNEQGWILDAGPDPIDNKFQRVEARMVIVSIPTDKTDWRRGDVLSEMVKGQPDRIGLNKQCADLPARDFRGRKEHVLVGFHVEVTERAYPGFAFAVVVLISEPDSAALDLIGTDDLQTLIVLGG